MIPEFWDVFAGLAIGFLCLVANFSHRITRAAREFLRENDEG